MQHSRHLVGEKTRRHCGSGTGKAERRSGGGGHPARPGWALPTCARTEVCVCVWPSWQASCLQRRGDVLCARMPRAESQAAPGRRRVRTRNSTPSAPAATQEWCCRVEQSPYASHQREEGRWFHAHSGSIACPRRPRAHAPFEFLPECGESVLGLVCLGWAVGCGLGGGVVSTFWSGARTLGVKEGSARAPSTSGQPCCG